ncbi:MAG: hypothetical protein JW772_03945 [Candidatus Diapherotrites archaeon]|nr:hypothetical protein [Candidatus Diapherotrites archaeon]
MPRRKPGSNGKPRPRRQLARHRPKLVSQKALETRLAQKLSRTRFGKAPPAAVSLLISSLAKKLVAKQVIAPGGISVVSGSISERFVRDHSKDAAAEARGRAVSGKVPKLGVQREWLVEARLVSDGTLTVFVQEKK